MTLMSAFCLAAPKHTRQFVRSLMRFENFVAGQVKYLMEVFKFTKFVSQRNHARCCKTRIGTRSGNCILNTNALLQMFTSVMCLTIRMFLSNMM